MRTDALPHFEGGGSASESTDNYPDELLEERAAQRANAPDRAEGNAEVFAGP